MKICYTVLAMLLSAVLATNSLAQTNQESDFESLTTKFERLLSAGDFKQLDGVLDQMDAAGIGEGNTELSFLKGLCSLENNKPNAAKKSLQKYLATGDRTYRANAQRMLADLPTSGLDAITNSIGMQLVRIPTGTFYMGSKLPYPEIQNRFNEVFANSPQKFADEHPRHRVNITNHLYAGKYEVTIEEFEQFVADTGYQTDSMRNGGTDGGFDPSAGEKTPTAKWVDANWREGNKDDPVSFVSWKDANEFVVWLGKREGKRYRLPTEAEWEYFARAGTSTLFSTGDSTESLAGYANVPDLTMKENWNSPVEYAVIPVHDGYVRKAPVGSFKPNAFGLYDIHGNVFEWCYDGYVSNGYSHHSATNPYIKADTELRVIRGGCFM